MGYGCAVVVVGLCFVEDDGFGECDGEGADAGPELWWEVQEAEWFCLLSVSEVRCLGLVKVC